MLNAAPILDMLMKYGFYILGPAIVIIGAFIAGIQHANKNSRLERLDAEKKLSEDIAKAERLNQNVEEKRNEDINSIRDTSTVDSLIRMWSKTWGPKS